MAFGDGASGKELVLGEVMREWHCHETSVFLRKDTRHLFFPHVFAMMKGL